MEGLFFDTDVLPGNEAYGMVGTLRILEPWALSAEASEEYGDHRSENPGRYSVDLLISSPG